MEHFSEVPIILVSIIYSVSYVYTQEHSKLLLSKEWLVKTDNQASTAYLFVRFSLRLFQALHLNLST
jgi:hypothetical protein